MPTESSVATPIAARMYALKDFDDVLGRCLMDDQVSDEFGKLEDQRHNHHERKKSAGDKRPIASRIAATDRRTKTRQARPHNLAPIVGTMDGRTPQSCHDHEGNSRVGLADIERQA